MSVASDIVDKIDSDTLYIPYWDPIGDHWSYLDNILPFVDTFLGE